MDGAVGIVFITGLQEKRRLFNPMWRDGMSEIDGTDLRINPQQDAFHAGDKIISVTLTGDTEELLTAQASRVEDWNATIAKSFPELG